MPSNVPMSMVPVSLLLLAACGAHPGGPGGPGGPVPPGQEPQLSFAPPLASPVPPAGAILLADWNHDGKLDGAITSGLSEYVLLGQGNGKFQVGTSYALHGGTMGATSGDLNGDGKPDLVEFSMSPDELLAFYGKGDGTFNAPLTGGAGRPNALLAADFNGDGKDDLAVASISETDGSGQLVVLLAGQKGGQVYPAPLPRALATADFNGDGKPDLAVGDNPNGVSFITIFLNTGDGHFNQGMRYDFNSPEVLSMAAGDLNGDGKPDLVFGGDYAMLGVLLGKGDGTFTAAPTAAVNGNRDGSAEMVFIDDLNGGGRPDVAALVVHGAGPAFLSVLLGHGDGTFSAPNTFGEFDTLKVDLQPLAAGDVDGDGRTDLVVTDGSSLAVFLNQSR